MFYNNHENTNTLSLKFFKKENYLEDMIQTNYHQDNEFIVPSELKIPTDPLNYKDLPALYQPYNSSFSF